MSSVLDMCSRCFETLVLGFRFQDRISFINVQFICFSIYRIFSRWKQPSIDKTFMVYESCDLKIKAIFFMMHKLCHSSLLCTAFLSFFFSRQLGRTWNMKKDGPKFPQVPALGRQEKTTRHSKTKVGNKTILFTKSVKHLKSM